MVLPKRATLRRFALRAVLALVALGAALSSAAPAAYASSEVIPGKGPASRISHPVPPPGALNVTTGRAAPRMLTATSPPAATTPPPVIRGRDNAVWILRNGSWQSLGGAIIADPAVAVIAPAVEGGLPENVYVATGTDHALWARNDAEGWRPLATFANYCIDGPAVTVSGTTGAYVLTAACRGGDSALWTMSGPAVSTQVPALNAKGTLGGWLRSQPAALTLNGVPTFYAVGGDSRVWFRDQNSGWQDFPSLQCYGHVEAGNAENGFAVVSCPGLDNALWFVRNGGAGWSSALSAGGYLTEDVQVRGMSTDVVADVAGGDFGDWETTIAATGVGGWGGLGATINTAAVDPYTMYWVPVYRQTYGLSCEAAAQQMALAAMGHYWSQTTLVNAERPDYRAGYWSGGTLRWGNPYSNFVGNPNGNEGAYTGYGVYYPVIAAVAQSHGVPNAWGGQGLSALQVYNWLAAGDPVQVWIEYQWVRPTMGYWLTFDGSRWIRYSTWEHSVTLVGVSSNAVLVNDPGHGTRYWVSRSQFQTSWGDFGNMAVVYQ